jgi:serine/threonine protein kinase
MHSAKLVHRDMKPANLLLNSECLMKVADFGLARSLLKPRPKGGEAGPSIDVGDEPSMDTLTDYVATRWYRAPEILFASDKYGVEVDMWSLGCIFAEMIGGKPVFNGKTTLNQVELIVNFVGYPSEEMMENGINSHYGSKMLESANVLSTPEQGPLSEAAQKAKWMELYGSFLRRPPVPSHAVRPARATHGAGRADTSLLRAVLRPADGDHLRDQNCGQARRQRQVDSGGLSLGHL